MSKGAKGAQQSGTQTSTQTLPDYMLPYTSTALGNITNLFNGPGPQYYPGQTVAGFSDPQQQAMQKIFQTGMGRGQGGLNAANNFDKMLLNGGGTNPYLDQTFNQAAQATQGQLASEFAGSGRDVGASMPLRSDQLNRLATDIYGGAYDQNMNRAMQAGNQVQDIYNTRMGGLGQALGIGNMVQGQGQKLIDANQQKYNYYQNLPYQQLQQYEQLLGGLNPGMQTSNPLYSNPMAQGMGNALMAMQIYGMGKNNGWWGGGGSSVAGSGGSSLGSAFGG